MFKSERGIAHLALIVFLLVGIALGVYLVQQKQIFAPKAGYEPEGPITGFYLVEKYVDEGGCTSWFGGWACPLKKLAMPEKEGKLIAVDLYARSDFDAANLFTAKLNFPTDLLEVVKIQTHLEQEVGIGVEDGVEQDKGKDRKEDGVLEKDSSSSTNGFIKKANAQSAAINLTAKTDCSGGKPAILLEFNDTGDTYTVESTPQIVQNQIPGRLTLRPLRLDNFFTPGVQPNTTYTVWIQSTSGTSSNKVTLTTSDCSKSAAFAVYGTVFVDSNKNQAFDGGETGMKGETVYIHSTDGKKVIYETQTAEDGTYAFKDIAKGTYRLTHYVPGGYERTTDDSFVFELSSDYKNHFGVVPKNEEQCRSIGCIQGAPDGCHYEGAFTYTCNPEEYDKLTCGKLVCDGGGDTVYFIKNWIEEYFDNEKGEISLVGGVPDPGYQTKQGAPAGLMATIYFRAKKADGEAEIKFTDDTAVFRNSDNQNIITTKNGITVSTGKVVPTPSPGLCYSDEQCSENQFCLLDTCPLSDRFCPEGQSCPQPICTGKCVETTEKPTPTPTPFPPGEGDGNGDGKVDLIDISVLLSKFNKADKGGIDMNNDGKINSFDLALLSKLLIEKGVIKSR